MAQFVQQTKNMSTPVAPTGTATALAANPARVYFKLQNLSVNPLYVLYAAGVASATNFHEILKGAATALDGTGGVVDSNVVVYTGAISVGGTAPSYSAYEVAP